MELVEFDLDLPYIVDEEKIRNLMRETGCLYNEATKLDYEMNWKNNRRNFRLETRCISAMFERVFKKFETEECWKILVECVSTVQEERVLNFSGVYSVQVKFNYENFLSSNDSQKKQKTLELLMEGCKIIANYKGWDIEPFEIVYQKIVEENYKNEWIWKNKVKNPNGKFYSELFMQHDVKSMNISILIRDTEGKEVSRKQILSELPDEFAYAKHLGILKWLSNDEVALFNKKRDRKFVFKMESIK